jgi:hypothetical protein
MTAAGAAISPAVTVKVLDAVGNTVTTPTLITLTLNANPGIAKLGGTLRVYTVNGIATFSNLMLNKAGNGYTLMANATGMTSVDSQAFSIIPANPVQLVFLSQPTNTVVNSFISPAITVMVQDAYGNTVNSSSTSVTLTLAANSTNATLWGERTQHAINGVATFSDVSIDTVGNAYVLIPSAIGLTGANSAKFNVTMSE